VRRNMATAIQTKLKFNENCLYRDLYLLNIGGLHVTIASGYMNPLHCGHIEYFRHARELGHALIVIVNSDAQVKIKGSQPFMCENERLNIVQSIRYVDYAMISTDKDGTVCETLREIRNLLPDCKLTFCKGGDRTIGNIPEADTCKELGIEMQFGIGGGKIQSSSWLLKRAKEAGNAKPDIR